MSEPDLNTNPYAPSNLTTDDLTATTELAGSHEELAKVATGLRLVYRGTGMVFFAILLIPSIVIVTAVVCGANNRNPTLDNAILLCAGISLCVVGVLLLAGIIIGVVGRAYCLTAPTWSEARGMIIGALTCDASALAVCLGSILPGLDEIAGVLCGILMFIGTVFFVLFLIRIAASINRTDLEERGRTLIKLGGLLIGACILLMPMAALFGPFIGILLFAESLAAIFLILRFLRVIIDLRKAILGEG